MMMIRDLLFVMLTFGLSSYVQATLLWDESVDGDLPNILRNDQISPNLVLQEGVNEIRGSASWVGLFSQGQYQGTYDADRARLTLLPGLQIDLIDYIFDNISLLQLADPFSPGVRLRQGYALTKGQYSVVDALFYKFWDFSDAVGEEVPTAVGTFNLLPATEPGSSYLIGTWVSSASLPTEWNYSWEYTASITVRRSNPTPVPTPGIPSLFIIALAGMLYSNRAAARSDRVPKIRFTSR